MTRVAIGPIRVVCPVPKRWNGRCPDCKRGGDGLIIGVVCDCLPPTKVKGKQEINMSRTKPPVPPELQLAEIRGVLYQRVPGQHGKFVDTKDEFRGEDTVDLVKRLVEPPKTNEDADQRIKDAVLDRIRAGNAQAIEALKRLVNLKLDCPFPLKKGVYGEDPKEERLSSCPIFTETYLYALFGKEDARTILAVLGRVAEALGTTLHGLHGDEED